jgi:hypothetical protein
MPPRRRLRRRRAARFDKLSPGGGSNDMLRPLADARATFGALVDAAVALGLAYVQLLRPDLQRRGAGVAPATDLDSARLYESGDDPAAGYATYAAAA